MKVTILSNIVTHRRKEKGYKELVDGKYVDATAAILAGLGSELEVDVELSGTSSESELGQEKTQPTTEESGTKSGPDREGSDGEGTDGSDGDELLQIDVSRED